MRKASTGATGASADRHISYWGCPARRPNGFIEGELLATLADEPLYLAEGWCELERSVVQTGSGVEIPAVRMGKRFATAVMSPR